MRAESARHVQDGHFRSPGHSFAGRIQLAYDAHVGALDVRIDKQRQIDRIDVVLKVLAVDVHQVVIALLGQLFNKQ